MERIILVGKISNVCNILSDFCKMTENLPYKVTVFDLMNLIKSKPVEIIRV